MDGPVWIYWEGPSPGYIDLCTRTARKYHPDLKVLNREDFEALRTTDRELDIDRLRVNHRSDYVRSYLLANYGGLYLDADCVVMRPLAPLLEGAAEVGFSGYREPDGYMSCNIMASQAHGAVITDHYQRVVAAISGGKDLEWLELASWPMDRAVEGNLSAARLLPTELIMPLPWRDNEQLCCRRPDEEHEKVFRPEALCYMLSNNTVSGHHFARALRYPEPEALLRDRSFFGFLVRRALGEPAPPAYDVPSHLGGHEDITQLDEGAFDYLIERYGAKTMVDVGCGPGGMLHYARSRGLDALGVDGDATVARDVPGVVEHDYSTGPLDLGRFDLGWSVEFVEHVDEAHVDNFMATFRRCQTVFITAAPPGQPGYHHVNCQNADYWVERFRGAGFALDNEGTQGVRAASTMWSRFTEHTGMVFRRES
ncbi:MAG TPA: glycosyltransferase [Acidimicrobiales bacterium]|nr:glycosyltransferase [Acidimicrobiales bacterium]